MYYDRLSIMYKRLTAFSSQTKNGVVYGILTDQINVQTKHNKILYVSEYISDLPSGFLGYIVFLKNEKQLIIPHQENISFTDEAINFENERLVIKIDFFNSVIYEIVDLSKGHIDLYLTGKCNQDCIACPQPRSARKDLFYPEEALEICKVLINQETHINISGGEPTFNKNYFIEVIKTLQINSPKSSLQILTNALNFANTRFIQKMINENIIFQNLLFSIAIYGSTSELHDKATGYNGGFLLLEKAISQITDLHAKVELRIVINQMNIRDLDKISEYIIQHYKGNIYRVVFMGLEMSGEANTNSELIWIPFNEHLPFLKDATMKLLQNNIVVYLYNYPLCYLSKSLWSLAKDSISYWKKDFPIACNNCKVKDNCAGFFTSTLPFIKEVFPLKQSHI